VGTSLDPDPIVLFDGLCNLCDGAVQFIIDRDARRRFRFASLQTPFARDLKWRHRIDGAIDSIILIESGRVYAGSQAALRITRHLDGAWPLLYGLIVLPRPVRDALYDLVARNRYRWFGRRTACRIPTPDLQARFLDQGSQPPV